MIRSVHFLVFDGFADWEPAFALAELRRSAELEVATVGFTSEPVRSMGGLRVLPDMALSDVDPAQVLLMLLPGGDLWEGEYPQARLASMLQALRAAAVPVAGICGATLALARAGLLDEHEHTSNERGYLERFVPEYAGASRYVDTLAVRDRGLITASGVGPTEFARAIFEELGVFNPSDRELWYHLFKTGRFPEPAA
jgi:putative intracellular protease/amidase